MGRHDVRLDLEAVVGSTDRLQDEVERLWEAVPSVSARDRMRFEMAVVEVFANIVQHAVGDDAGPRRRVEVDLAVSDDLVSARFVDDGRPAAVDLQDVGMPPPDAEGGRGLALTLASVDHLEYERDGGTNRWTMTCRRAV